MPLVLCLCGASGKSAEQPGASEAEWPREEPASEVCPQAIIPYDKNYYKLQNYRDFAIRKK